MRYLKHSCSVADTPALRSENSLDEEEDSGWESTRAEFLQNLAASGWLTSGAGHGGPTAGICWNNFHTSLCVKCAPDPKCTVHPFLRSCCFSCLRSPRPPPQTWSFEGFTSCHSTLSFDTFRNLPDSLFFFFLHTQNLSSLFSFQRPCPSGHRYNLLSPPLLELFWRQSPTGAGLVQQDWQSSAASSSGLCCLEPHVSLWICPRSHDVDGDIQAKADSFPSSGGISALPSLLSFPSWTLSLSTELSFHPSVGPESLNLDRKKPKPNQQNASSSSLTLTET